MDRPLLLGSVKANIGHLEAAAGIAGLIKVGLSLQAGELPGQAHFQDPNPRIAWSSLPVSVVRERQAWPLGRRLAGVSAFGFSGTNAHVIVEGYAEAEGVSGGRERSAEVLALSAKTPGALRELAGRYEAFLSSSPGASVGDICFTAGIGRSHFEHRAAIVAGGRRSLLRDWRRFSRARGMGRFMSAIAGSVRGLACCSRVRAASGRGWVRVFTGRSLCSVRLWSGAARRRTGLGG